MSKFCYLGDTLGSGGGVVEAARAVVPNLFCLKGHLFFMEGIEGHEVDFFPFHSPLLPPFSSPHSPLVQQLWVLGERCKLHQRGPRQSPSRQRIFEHSRAKGNLFDMLREILQLSKQLEIFRFLPRISYFHHN